MCIFKGIFFICSYTVSPPRAFEQPWEPYKLHLRIRDKMVAEFCLGKSCEGQCTETESNPAPLLRLTARRCTMPSKDIVFFMPGFWTVFVEPSGFVDSSDCELLTQTFVSSATKTTSIPCNHHTPCKSHGQKSEIMTLMKRKIGERRKWQIKLDNKEKHMLQDFKMQTLKKIWRRPTPKKVLVCRRVATAQRAGDLVSHSRRAFCWALTWLHKPMAFWRPIERLASAVKSKQLISPAELRNNNLFWLLQIPALADFCCHCPKTDLTRFVFSSMFAFVNFATSLSFAFWIPNFTKFEWFFPLEKSRSLVLVCAEDDDAPSQPTSEPEPWESNWPEPCRSNWCCWLMRLNAPKADPKTDIAMQVEVQFEFRKKSALEKHLGWSKKKN